MRPSPGFAFVVWAVDFSSIAASFFFAGCAIVHKCIHDIGIERRYSQSKTADKLSCRQAFSQTLPARTSIHGFVQCTSLTGYNIIPGFSIPFPCRSIERLIVRRIHDDFDNPDFFGDVENFLPGFSSIRGFKHPPFFVIAIVVTKSCDIDNIRIIGVDENPRDMVSVMQAHICPSLSSICGFKHSGSGKWAPRHQDLSCTHPDNVGIGWSDGDTSDCKCGLILEDRFPGGAVVNGFPEIPGSCAHIYGVGIIGKTGDSFDPASLKLRTHRPPF